MNVPINQLTPMEAIRVRCKVMQQMFEKLPHQMSWYRSHVISTTLPSSFMTF